MPATLGNNPRYLEELRLGGGYGSTPDGGADLDGMGNMQTNGGIECDGDGTIGGNLHANGALSLDGLNTTWSTYLPATLGHPDPVLPCGPLAVTNWRNYHVATPSLAFDPDTPEAAYFQFRLPKAYDGRPLNFTIEWSATAGSSGDVRWGVLPISFLDGMNLANTGVTTYVVDSLSTANALHTCTVSAIPTSANEQAVTTVRIIRLSNHATDTLNETSLLLGIAVRL